MIFVEFTFSLEILKEVYSHLFYGLAKCSTTKLYSSNSFLRTLLQNIVQLSTFNAMDNPELALRPAKMNDRTPIIEPSAFSIAKTYSPELSPSPGMHFIAFS
jgi:hypothetical protein